MRLVCVGVLAAEGPLVQCGPESVVGGERYRVPCSALEVKEAVVVDMQDCQWRFLYVTAVEGVRVQGSEYTGLH